MERALHDGRVREKVERARRQATLDWIAHSIWISGWAGCVAALVGLAAAWAAPAYLFTAVGPILTQAHPRLVAFAAAAPFAIGALAGVVAYGLARGTHPRPIRRGHQIRGPLIGFVTGLVAGVAALLVVLPWSFPTNGVLHDSGRQVIALANDNAVVPGSLYQDPEESSLYFEATIGAWIETPVQNFGPRSVYAQLVRVAGPHPFTTLDHVADAIGSRQVDAFRKRIDYLWGLAGFLVLALVTALLWQRRRWRAPILVPPLSRDAVNAIWDEEREEAQRDAARATAASLEATGAVQPVSGVDA